MIRIRECGARALPLALLLAFYWPGLTNWFYQDDFGWLNLRREVHSLSSLAPALFAPKAHGNMRPLGENAYFLIFSSLFGVNPLPFRLGAFATQMLSLLLLGSITLRLTASRLAAMVAQILWISNCAMADIMSWTSIYNQVLSGFFFLLGFYFLLRSIETGERKYDTAQWLAFVLGLGALEINVTYPALAALYAWLFARPFLKKILPMFLVSALWMLAHFHFAPVSHEGPYALHAGSRLLSTLWTYWTLALGPPRLAVVRPVAPWIGAGVITVLTAATAALLIRKTVRREYLGLFAIAWFVITAGPYLPLSEHVMAYYLAVPAIGLALLGAWAVACAWRAGARWKLCATLCVALYLAVSLPAAWAITRWHHERGVRVQDLVLGVAEIHQAEPGKIVLLDGIDSDLFWSGIVDVPFRVMEIPHVYLAPGSDAHIQAPPGLVTKFQLPWALALNALEKNQAVVYRMEGGALRNVTGGYRTIAQAAWKPETPRFVNLGDAVYQPYLGAGWSEIADGYRYMSKTGSMRIGAPKTGTESLYLGVFRVDDFHLNLSVNGVETPARRIRRDFELSEFEAALPPALAGAKDLELTVSSDAAEPLKFGYAEIR